MYKTLIITALVLSPIASVHAASSHDGCNATTNQVENETLDNDRLADENKAKKHVHDCIGEKKKKRKKNRKKSRRYA